MKKIFLLLFILLQTLQAQSPQTAVEAFFDAFHKKDSLQLASFFHSEAVLQSVGTAANGETKLRSIPVDRFVQAVCTRPDTPVWREELGKFTVLTDPPLAVVWVPYIFYLDGEVLHSGVNCFQWVRQNSQWKIISLTDTRH